jgi:hypothetical protein
MGINETPVIDNEIKKTYRLNRIISYFKGNIDSQYILKTDKDEATLYTSELDTSWWKAKTPLMKVKSNGNGITVTHRPGDVRSKFKKFELNYADAEYLLILLKSLDYGQHTKHRKIEY